MHEVIVSGSPACFFGGILEQDRISAWFSQAFSECGVKCSACSGTIPAAYAAPPQPASPPPATQEVAQQQQQQQPLTGWAAVAALSPEECAHMLRTDPIRKRKMAEWAYERRLEKKHRARIQATTISPGSGSTKARRGPVSVCSRTSSTASSAKSTDSSGTPGGGGNGTAQIQVRQLRDLKNDFFNQTSDLPGFAPSAPYPVFPPKSTLPDMKDRMNENRRKKYAYDQECIEWHAHELKLLAEGAAASTQSTNLV